VTWLFRQVVFKPPMAFDGEQRGELEGSWLKFHGTTSLTMG